MTVQAALLGLLGAAHLPGAEESTGEEEREHVHLQRRQQEGQVHHRVRVALPEDAQRERERTDTSGGARGAAEGGGRM